MKALAEEANCALRLAEKLVGKPEAQKLFQPKLINLKSPLVL